MITSLTKLAKAKKSIKLVGVRPEQFFLATKDAQKFLIGYVNQRFDLAVIDLFTAAVANKTITEDVDAANGVFGRKYNLANSGVDLIATNANQASKSAVAKAKAAILAKNIKVIN